MVRRVKYERSVFRMTLKKRPHSQPRGGKVRPDLADRGFRGGGNLFDADPSAGRGDPGRGGVFSDSRDVA